MYSFIYTHKNIFTIMYNVEGYTPCTLSKKLYTYTIVYNEKKMHMIIYNDWYIDTILIMIWKYTLASKMNTSKKCTQSWSEGHKYWFY